MSETLKVVETGGNLALALTRRIGALTYRPLSSAAPARLSVSRKVLGSLAFGTLQDGADARPDEARLVESSGTAPQWFRP